MNSLKFIVGWDGYDGGFLFYVLILFGKMRELVEDIFWVWYNIGRFLWLFLWDVIDWLWEE